MDIEVSEPTMRKAVPLQLPGDIQPDPNPPPKDAPKPKELTQAELEERRKNVLKSMGYDEELAKDQPPAGQPKTQDKPQAAAPAEEPPPETEEQRKKREEDEALAAQADREAKEDERITRVATATAAAVKDAIKPEEKPAPTAPVAEEATLDPEDAADLEAVEFLAETNPEKLPKGVTADTFRKYYKELYAYRDQWVKDNPGKEFNPADEEHSEFIQKNEPDVPVQLLDTARDEVKFEKRFRQRVQPQLEAIELREQLKTVAPVVGQAINDAVVEVARLVSPKIHEVITKDGKIDLSEAIVKEADKVDPIARRVIQKVIGEELSPAITVIEQSAALQGRFPWDPKNVHHARVLDEILECDRIMSEAPANVRMVKGKEFITIADLQQKRNDILTSRSTQADKNAELTSLGKKYWTLTEKDWKETIIKKQAEKALDQVNYLEEMAAISNGKTATPRTLGAKSQPKEQPPKPAAQRPKPNSPRVPGSDGVIAPPGSLTPKNLSPGEKAVQVHFS